MINLQIFRFKKLHLHPVSWVPNNYHILRIIDRRLTFGGINLKSPVLTILSALTSLSSYEQCLCKFIMNFIEDKVKYSGIDFWNNQNGAPRKFLREISTRLRMIYWDNKLSSLFKVIAFSKSCIFHLCWEIVKLMIVRFHHKICSLETTIVCAKSTADPHIRPIFGGIESTFNQFWQFEVL